MTLDSDRSVGAIFEPGVYRPDASVKRAVHTVYVDPDVYSTDGSPQSLTAKTMRGKTGLIDATSQ